jgi:hypothetical protein
VKTIDNNAFQGCENLTSVTIPDGVTTIGESAFASCPKLSAISVSPENTNFSSEDGVLYDKGQFVLHTYPAGKKDITFTIPSSVTTIGGYAFQGCDSLATLTISGAVTTIGGGAFAACPNLSEIHVSQANTSYVSDNGVLYDKSQLFLHTYPAGRNATKFAIPASVTTINESAFQGCTELVMLTIPNSVTTIGEFAFSYCAKLETVIVDWATPLSVPATIFLGDSLAQTLRIPAGTQALYEDAFVWKNFKVIKEIWVILEETQPIDLDGKGKIALNLFIPDNAIITGMFEIQFPDYMALDEESTTLSNKLSGNNSLSFTVKEDNTWLIEINQYVLKNATMSEDDDDDEADDGFRNFMEIVFSANENVSKGVFEATITEFDLTLDDGTPIQEDLLTVTVHVNQIPTATEKIHDKPFKVYFIDNRLRVESPHRELITVYSIAGVQLYSTLKNADIIEITFPTQFGSIYFIKGSVSGTKKVAHF